MSTIEAQVTEDPYAQRKLTEGRNLIWRYFPFLLPTEPTSVICRPMDPIDWSNYEGKLRGIHYVSLNHTNLVDHEEERTLSVVHELSHVRHAEYIGQIEMVRIDLDEEITDEELATTDLATLFALFDKDVRVDSTFFSDALIEGLATNVEWIIDEGEIYRLTVMGDILKATKLKKIKDDLNDFITKCKDDPEIMMYYDGALLVNTMIQRAGLQGVFEFLKRVDYRACNRIEAGSRKYRELLRDPSLIPTIR